uniref:BHLH domain-containing protein n=1 Tax=Mesocestoides corti TaxID=53468 RepID=A0A5K3EYY0_MESCO
MAEGSKRLIKCRPSNYISHDWQASRVRFTHNEIERKRRARLKSETDFLHQQLPKAVYRDKLAVFKAGAELLLKYSNSNGSDARNLILTDSEYSACILNNFQGFGMQIRCEDGMILMTTQNWSQCLGPDFSFPTGKKIREVILSTELTEGIIEANLSLSPEERAQLTNGQVVARNFILPVVSTSSTLQNLSERSFCLIECCGDIALLPTAHTEDGQVPANEPVLQVICRALEHKSTDQDVSNGKLFSLRIQPESHLILELNSHELPAGVSPGDMIGHSLVDLTSRASQPIIEKGLNNAARTGEAEFTISLERPSALAGPLQFLVVVKAITVCDSLHCLVADFYPHQKQEP